VTALAPGQVRVPARTSPGRPVSAAQLGVVASSVIALLFLGLPVAAIVARAALSGGLVDAAASGAVLDALVLSLVTTLASLALTLTFGMPLAFVLARREFRGKTIAEALVDLPIVLPPSVAGLGLLLAFGTRGLLGGAFGVAGLSIPFTTLAVVLAQTFVSAPLFVRSARTGFRGVDHDQEDAARVDGAAPGSVFRHVTLPLASGAVGAGLVLAWARALGEFGATIMFAGNVAGRTRTLPLFVYSEFQSSLDASVAAAAVLVLAAFGVLVAVRLSRWRTGADAGALP